MCGALETRPPSGPNTAQEKSRRSLMLVEMEVLWRTRPICSVKRQETDAHIRYDPLPTRRRCVTVLTPSTAGRVPAMLMKRCEKMESWTALSSVPRAQPRSEPTVRQTSPDSVKQASQLGSTRMVLIEQRALFMKGL